MFWHGAVMKVMTQSIFAVIASLGVLAATAAEPGGAASAKDATAALSPDAAAAAPAPAGAGLRAYVDADGALSEAPPGREADRSIVLPRRNYDLMWTEPMPDGGVLLHTEGQLQMSAMARIGADGRIEQYCAPAARPAPASAAATAPAADPAR